MIMILTIILFGVLTIILLSGKGSFLVAGYNTSSKEEKEQYDQIKLSRLTGVMMLLIMIFLVISYFYKSLAPLLLSFGTISVVIGYMLLIDPLCHKSHKKNSRQKNVGITIVGVILIVFVCFTMFSGKIDVVFYEDHMECHATLTKRTMISYEDIEKIELLKNIDIGSRKKGVNNAVISAGVYENDVFGEYTLYCYNRFDEYIALYTNDGIVVISNEKDMFDRINEKIE